MDRRFLTVVGVSLLFALVVSGVFYQLVAGRKGGSKSQKTQTRGLVVAARPLPVGQTVKADDVMTMKVPVDQFPKDGFEKVAEVLERPVISSVLAEEPLREGRLGQRGAGVGLAPMIPLGMRAVSVRVNEVVGVAGFALPGMRVDVLVTGKPPQREGSITRTVLQNILVLSAGHNIEPDAKGQPINAAVVTLLVSPEQAETIILAGNEGRVQLVLRNTGDQGTQPTPGRGVAELYGSPKESTPRPVVQAVAQAAPKPPEPVAKAPAPPPTEEIVVIRGNQKTVEIVSARKVEAGQP